MQLISGPVGHGCKNKNHHDVALVQAILVLTERPTTSPQCGKPYLAHYDGDYGKHTDEALRAFQHDHVFVAPGGKQPPGDAPATPGRVDPDDGTWRKLVEKVAPDFGNLRVLSGGRTVYLPAPVGQLSQNLLAANTMTFAPVFRPKVIACITRVFDRYGIAVSVCPDGDRRDFETQYGLTKKRTKTGKKVTHAGPGESNHNFGQAVDLGFKGLRWLDDDGSVVVEDKGWLLNRLDPDVDDPGPEALCFWEALRSVGTKECGLHPSKLPGDHPHLQAWDDHGVDMFSRLADLLTRSGTMKWSGTKHHHYQCDLGLGGKLFKVGTAVQIWNGEATVTPEMLTPKRAAVKHAPARKGVANTAAAAQEEALKTELAVEDKQDELRRQFDLADDKWQNWTAK